MKYISERYLMYKKRHPIAEFFWRYRVSNKSIAKACNVAESTVSKWFSCQFQIPIEKVQILEGLRRAVLESKYSN